jgi:thermostable 8-oxoguanine DNA glycosylase
MDDVIHLMTANIMIITYHNSVEIIFNTPDDMIFKRGDNTTKHPGLIGSIFLYKTSDDLAESMRAVDYIIEHITLSYFVRRWDTIVCYADKHTYYFHMIIEYKDDIPDWRDNLVAFVKGIGVAQGTPLLFIRDRTWYDLKKDVNTLSLLRELNPVFRFTLHNKYIEEPYIQFKQTVGDICNKRVRIRPPLPSYEAIEYYRPRANPLSYQEALSYPDYDMPPIPEYREDTPPPYEGGRRRRRRSRKPLKRR